MEKLCSHRGYSRAFTYRFFVLAMLTFCFWCTGAKAQGGTAIYDAINIGTLNTCSGSSFSDVRNNSPGNGFSDTYGQVSPDVWYTFTIGSSAQVDISTCASLFDTYLHVLDAGGNLIASIDDNGPLCTGTRASLQPFLSAGTYFIVAEGYSASTGDIQLNVSVAGGGSLPAGATMANAIDAGTITAGAGGFSDSRSNADACMGNEIGQYSNDIFYRFTLASTSVVRLSHCGSGFDTYMHLLDNTGTPIATNDDNGPLCTGTAASIKTELPAGTYYLVSEGYSGNSGIINTSISVELQGSLFSNAINVGVLSSGASYSDTKNNTPGNGYGNELGQPSEDIFYKFTLNSSTLTEVTISHCGSAFDTYLHLLDAAGNSIATNDDSGPACAGLQSSIRIALGSGTYYVVSEGYSSYSGDIITQISVGRPQGWTSSNQNYVRIRVPRTNISDYSTLESLSANKDLVQTSTKYYDGLGRLIQTIQRQASPGGSDVVQAVIYDARGREYRKYLSYRALATDGEFKIGNPDENVKAFYNPASPGAPNIAVTAYPYAEAVIEKSPLNRILSQGAPGDSWQPFSASIPNSGHTIKTGLAGNTSAQVKLWVVSGTSCTAAGDYNAFTLLKTTVTDENGGNSIEYKDRLGHVVLKQVEYASGSFTNTYYVYDDLGNIRYVIPPAVTVNSFTEADAVFDQYIYAYHYDDQNRLTEKKNPGKGWEYTVYNQLDQTILTQDGVQRASGKWLFTRYDAAGQIVMTGKYTNAGDRATVQASVDAHTGGAYETFTGAGTEGYGINTFPQQNYTILTVNYYGTYNIPGKTSLYDASVAVSNSVRGLLTGSKTNILGSTDYLLSISYYDDHIRQKELITQNHLGGVDRIVNTFNFSGELTSSLRTHNSSSASVTVLTRNVYDHMGRKKQAFEQINSAPEVKLSESTYNEVGQLIVKTHHNDQQTTIYSYNARGWLKTSVSSEFAMQLKYEDGATPQYNGNISAQLWGDGNLTNSFDYTYDKQNRLLSGVSTGIAMSEVMTYDLMGNITSLIRDANPLATFAYTGNQLNQVSGGITTGAYSYNQNGSAVVDGHNGVSLTYNVLNLPATATKSGLNLVYTYSATGKKLRKQSNGVTRDYVNGIEYNGNVIDLIYTEDGLARNNGGVFSYEYNLKDHLGNVRRTVYRNPVNGAIETIQKDDYYPFGQRRVASAGQNKNLYNGKELQDELGQYDYGARFYDPVIARWIVADPLAEATISLTPYHYANNNPISFTDPLGLSPVYSDGAYYDNGVEVSWGYVYNWLQTNDGIAATYRPLTKDRLEEIAKEQGYGGSQGAFRANVGNAFQKLALEALELDEYKGANIPSADRALKTGGQKQFVRPDAASDISINLFWHYKGHYYDVLNDYSDEAFSYFEVKGIKAGTISVSYDQYQILGELDALSKSPAAAQGNRAMLTFVTLGNTFVGPSVIKAAMEKKVAIWQIWALEEVSGGVGTGNIAFSGAFPLYDGPNNKRIPIPTGLPWIANTEALPLPAPNR